MTIYKFHAVKHTTSKRIPCAGCGKKLVRQQTFSQTVNPFNKNVEGYPKTTQEIYTELRADAAEWKQDTADVWCKSCLAE